MENNKAVDNTQQQANSAERRIQVSATKQRRFYYHTIRRHFAADTAHQKVQLTALGTAIGSAISVAHELQDEKVATITGVRTFWSTVEARAPPAEGAAQQAPPAGAAGAQAAQPQKPRPVPRIEIEVLRKPEWTPEEEDVNPPPRRARVPAAGGRAPQQGEQAPATATNPSPVQA